MVEHLILVSVVAPLLALASRRRATTAWLVIGTTAATVALIAWHVPVLFDAATSNNAVHGLQHLSLVGAATLLWWAVWRVDSAGNVLALFIAGLPAIALGAALTLAESPWYAAYPDIGDQRVAGALMWGAGSVTGLAAAAAAFARWLVKASPSQGTTSARGS